MKIERFYPPYGESCTGCALIAFAFAKEGPSQYSRLLVTCRPEAVEENSQALVSTTIVDPNHETIKSDIVGDCQALGPAVSPFSEQ